MNKNSQSKLSSKLLNDTTSRLNHGIEFLVPLIESGHRNVMRSGTSTGKISRFRRKTKKLSTIDTGLFRAPILVYYTIIIIRNPPPPPR